MMRGRVFAAGFLNAAHQAYARAKNLAMQFSGPPMPNPVPLRTIRRQCGRDSVALRFGAHVHPKRCETNSRRRSARANLNAFQGPMRFDRKLDRDRVTRLHRAASDHHTHHAGLAHQRSVRRARQHQRFAATAKFGPN